MKKRIVVLTALFALSLVSLGQEKKQKYSFLKYKKDKTVYIKKGKFLSVYLFDQFDSITRVTKTTTIRGRLISLNDSILILGCRQEWVSWDSKDSVKSISQSLRTNYKKPTNREIDIFTIESLSYDRPIGGVAAVICYISSMTAVVVAPLASYNFSNGTFNGDKYLKIVKPSLAVSGVFMVLSLSLHERQFRIKH